MAALDRLARGLVGPEYSTRELGAAVAALSRVYTRDRGQLGQLDATKQALLARLGFFFARDLPKVFGPLDELAGAGLMPQRTRLRVLDIGAGLGATSFGIARWLRLRGHPAERLEVVALEQSSGALRSFQAIANAFRELPDEFVPLGLDARNTDLHKARLSQRFDLVTFGFVLNELFASAKPDERAALRAELLLEAAKQLGEGGAIIVLEPALKESARELMALRNVLAARTGPPFVVAPCLHALDCPMLPSERDWCHQELPYALPPRLAEVARAASLRYEGLSYASLVLATAARPSLGAGTVRVVSDRLESKGKLELFGCGEHGYERLTQLTRAASPRNAPFASARRGDILAVEGARKRIDEHTQVTKLNSPPKR